MDGTDNNDESSDNKDEEEQETENSHNRLRFSSYPYAFMLHCTILQLHVASFFDIERHGRKVHAFVFPPHAAALVSLDTEATALVHQQEREAIEDERKKQSEAFRGLLASWSPSTTPFKPENVGLRELLIAQFIKENLDIDETGKRNRKINKKRKAQ